MNIKKIALSMFLATCATPVFATELRSIQLEEYNCEESTDIEVKACLETTLSQSVARLNETEYHFKKAIEESHLTPEAVTNLKNVFNEEKEAYTLYSQKQCNLKVAIEGLQNADANLERLSIICQINAMDNKVEKLTEFTHDIINDYVSSKTSVMETTDKPVIPYPAEAPDGTTTYSNTDNQPSEIVEPIEVVPDSETLTPTDQTPTAVFDTDVEDDI